MACPRSTTTAFDAQLRLGVGEIRDGHCASWDIAARSSPPKGTPLWVAPTRCPLPFREGILALVLEDKVRLLTNSRLLRGLRLAQQFGMLRRVRDCEAEEQRRQVVPILEPEPLLHEEMTKALANPRSKVGPGGVLARVNATRKKSEVPLPPEHGGVLQCHAHRGLLR